MSGDTSRPVPETYPSFLPPRGIPGIYRFWVRVSNTEGFVNSRTVVFTVVASPKPLIIRQPNDTVTYQGAGESISVSAKGDDLSYAWYGGESGDTSALLKDWSSSFSPSVVTPGIYRYWARVSNPSGHVDSAAVTYLVKSPGTGLISRHPLDATTELDSTISLSVVASGTSLSYQWFSGATGDDSSPLSGKTSNSFSPPVSTVGQYSYWVRVTSGQTVEDSETVEVKVVSRILVITDPPLDRVTYVGTSIYYYVYTQGSNVTYRWYSGNSGDTSNPLPNETSYSFGPPVSAAGVFRYWMRATSGDLHVDSPAATVTVTVIGRPPVFEYQPQDQEIVQAAGSVSLSATLLNSTGASWQWYRGTRGDTASPVVGATGSSISVSKSSGGLFTYWVRATNSYGHDDSRTATVTVRGTRYG
ncbi:MAG: hypothetical protein EOP84_28805, partial [Verrucomicrobiaceae bacterium]